MSGNTTHSEFAELFEEFATTTVETTTKKRCKKKCGIFGKPKVSNSGGLWKSGWIGVKIFWINSGRIYEFKDLIDKITDNIRSDYAIRTNYLVYRAIRSVYINFFASIIEMFEQLWKQASQDWSSWEQNEVNPIDIFHDIKNNLVNSWILNNYDWVPFVFDIDLLNFDIKKVKWVVQIANDYLLWLNFDTKIWKIFLFNDIIQQLGTRNAKK